MLSITKVIAIWATAASVSSAQSLSSFNLNAFLNANLTDTCRIAAGAQITALALSCIDLSSLLSVFSSDGLDTDALFAKPTFLNSLCTASCNRTLTSFGDSLSRVCGDSDIFSSSIAETSLGFIGASNYTSPETNTTIPSSLNATTVTSYLQFVRSISCIKTTPSSSSYCVNEQFTEVRKAGATWNILNITATIVSNTSVACSDCIKTQLDVAYNSTKFVDYAALKPGLIEAYKYWNETCGEETPVIKRRHQISRRRRGLLF